MIPKVIHYCWFGGNSLPEEAKRCIESWKKYCPDYKIIEWNENNYDVNSNEYMKAAYKEKKWAFVSDYARIDVVYKYGGIYMDTDVELVKELDSFLNDRIANILFPFATSIYVSRILLPAGVGKVASAQNIVSYFVTLAALGLPSYGVREFAKVREKKHERNKLFTELLLVNIISTTLAVVGFIGLVVVNEGFSGQWELYVKDSNA